jgi:hypothetical protein
VLILTYLYLDHAAGRFKPLTSAVDIPFNSNSDAAGGFKPLMGVKKVFFDIRCFQSLTSRFQC